MFVRYQLQYDRSRIKQLTRQSVWLGVYLAVSIAFGFTGWSHYINERAEHRVTFGEVEGYCEQHKDRCYVDIYNHLVIGR